MTQLMFIVILQIFFTITTGQVIFPGKCQNVTTQQNFSMPKFSGRWYQIYKYSNIPHNLQNCTTIDQTVLSNGSMELNKSLCMFGKKVHMLGTITELSPTKKDGKLVMRFPTLSQYNSDFWILSTDYTNYYVGWTCTPTGNNTNVQNSWIAVRTLNFTEEVKSMINVVIKLNNLDKTKYIRINHTYCCSSSDSLLRPCSYVLFSVMILSFLKKFP